MLAITFIAISGIAIGLFTVLLIIKNKRLSKPKAILVAWIAALVLNMAYFLCVSPGMELLSDSPSIIHIIGTGLVLIHAPLLYIFCSRLFFPELSLKLTLHFLPFILYFLVIGSISLFFQDSISFRYGFIRFKDTYPILNFYGIYLALVSGIYTVMAFVTIRKQKRLLNQTQSGEIRNVLNWLEYWVTAAILFFVFTYLLIEFSVSTNQIDTRFTFQIISVFLSVYIIYVSYWAIRKTSAFQHLKPSILIEKTNPSNTLSPTEIEIIAGQIVEVLEKDKCYLDPDFSLTALSNALNIPSGKLSLAINKGLEKNFYDLINTYRVREFKNRLTQGADEQMSLLGVAFDCGFRSKSTFNSFLKRKQV